MRGSGAGRGVAGWGTRRGLAGGLAGDSLGISGGLALFLGDSLRETERFPRVSGGLARDHAGLL